MASCQTLQQGRQAIAAVRNQAASGALVGVTSRQAARALPLSLGRVSCPVLSLTTGVVEAGIGAGMSYANRERTSAKLLMTTTYTAGDVARECIIAAHLVVLWAVLQCY